MNIFQKEMTLTADKFPELRAPKSRLDKCLKSSASDDLSTDTVANASKQCCNLIDGTFTISINHCEGNCGGKGLFY